MVNPLHASSPRPVSRGWRGGRCVDRLRLSVLEEPLAEPVPMSLGLLGVRHSLVVEVAVEGQWGVGETWVNHPDWAWQERLLTFRHGLAPLLDGRGFDDPRVLLSDLAAALLPRATQGGMAAAVWQALSGLDIALWDVLGKLSGRSVAEMLHPGRVPATEVDVYASGIGPTRVHELCGVAARQGVHAVKARLGFGVDTDTTTLARIRAELGDDVQLFADANRAWSMAQAVAMGPVLREFGVAWVEEPLRHDRPDLLAHLTERTGVAVAAGENLYGGDAFEDYLSQGRLTVIQPDPAKSGGLSTCAGVAQAAEAHGVAVSPHCYSGGVALASTVQLAAAFANVAMVEVDVRPSELRTSLLRQGWGIADGRLAVPRGPGLGIEIDEETRSRHVVAEEEIVLSGSNG